MLWNAVVRQRARAKTLGWGLADQAMSSLTNMALGLLAARSLGLSAFGAFSLAFATYLIVLGTSRALNTEPFVIRYTGAPPDTWKDATRSATGSAVLVGIAAGLACGMVGRVVGGSTGATFVALGLSLPGLLAQDAWRYAFFASGREARAFINDLVWGLLLLPLIVSLAISDSASAAWFMLAWGAAASGAAVVGMVQARVVPRVRNCPRWWRENRSLALGFLGNFAAASGTSNMLMFAIAAIAGMEAVGSLRAAEILLGPLNVLFFGIFLSAVPEGVRLLRGSSAALRRWCFLLSSVLPAAALLWGLAVHLLPSAVGNALLKSTWDGASSLIIPLALARAGVGLAVGAEAGLRALAAAGRTFRAQLTTGALWLAGGTVGAALAEAGGAAWGLALAAPIAAVGWWWFFARTLRAREAEEGSTLPQLLVEQDNPALAQSPR